MVYVLLMSTNNDIVNVQLDPSWGVPAGRFQWAQVMPGGLNIPNQSTIVVIAHGNNNEIGNARPGVVDIKAEAFLALVHFNMAPQASPAAVYISACGAGIAQFAASVALTAQANQIWQNTSIFGHVDAVVGPVPGQRSLAWYQIFPAGARQPAIRGSASTTTAPSWPSATTITKPSSKSGKYNQPGVKHYVFNETGNIMFATTQGHDAPVSPSAIALFQEVAVFFAAMTKAITTTPRLGATPPYAPTDYYTIYDYAALSNVIDGSGLFVNVQQEDLAYSTKSVTADFSTEFIEALLGVALTDGVGLAVLQATLNAMGKQASVAYSATGEYQQVGNLLFVCEYLMGMPLVTVLYFYLDESEVQSVLSVSPCLKVSSDQFSITVHKDTYMFVPPAWIRQYGGDLASIQDDAAYQQLVKDLQALITNSPMVTSVTPLTSTSFAPSTAITLAGVNFGSTAGKVIIGGVLQTVATGAWTDTSIPFSAVNTTQQDLTGPIVVIAANGNTTYTALEYTVTASS